MRGVVTHDPHELEEAVVIGRSLSDTMVMRMASLYLGEYYHGEDTSLERRYLEQCRAASTAVGDRWLTAIALGALANLALARGDTDEARRLYEEALVLEQALHNKLGAGSWLGCLGHLARERGDLATARSYYRDALADLRDTGAPAWIAEVLHGVARLFLAEGQPARALQLTSAVLSPHSAWLASVERDAAVSGEVEEWHSIRTEALNCLDPIDAAAAWAAGEAMTMEPAIAYALEELREG
jgi:tetratricopeptide (TPR) repeat protein